MMKGMKMLLEPVSMARSLLKSAQYYSPQNRKKKPK